MSPDGGRAFLGGASLHYGTHTFGNPALDTYQFGQLDAIRSKVPVNLAARVCRDDPAPNKRSCNTTSDCVTVGGGPCTAASPELSFKHQISLVDWRGTSAPRDLTIDRGVLHAQIVGTSTWEKLMPYENVHDTQAFIWHCSFDPIDDGNTEDDFFDPTDPERLLGPSSTCFPEFVFGYIGDTDGPFNPVDIGRASDGPGLQGSVGIGTWVESRFDLSRFRGRSIRLRFVLTSVQPPGHISWEDTFMWNPVPYDDGWYVDDLRVSQTLGAASATVTLDAADNSALPGNIDGDARGDECDCAPFDPSVFAVAEVTGLRLDPDRVTLRWDSAIPGSGPATVHDVVRGVLTELPVGGGSQEICLESGTAGTTATDSENPPSGAGFWYLVRSRNSCGGTYGVQSGGAERMTAACP
jgi:hypothetical protein